MKKLFNENASFRKCVALVFALVATICCISAFSFSNRAIAYDSGDWSQARGNDNIWQVNANDIKATGINADGYGNFLLTEDNALIGDYSAEVKIQPDYDTTIKGKVMEFGIVPWYIDESNWVRLRLGWMVTQATVSYLQLDTCIGGEMSPVRKVNGAWVDGATDQLSWLQIGDKSNSVWTLKVERKLNDAGDG